MQMNTSDCEHRFDSYGVMCIGSVLFIFCCFLHDIRGWWWWWRWWWSDCNLQL